MASGSDESPPRRHEKHSKKNQDPTDTSKPSGCTKAMWSHDASGAHGCGRAARARGDQVPMDLLHRWVLNNGSGSLALATYAQWIQQKKLLSEKDAPLHQVCVLVHHPRVLLILVKTIWFLSKATLPPF